MKTQGAKDREWDEICQVITDAFSNDKPVWEELVKQVGSTVGEIDHQPKGDSVWHLDISRIMPKPHRSVLDYARVARPRPGESWRRIVPDAPRPAQALQGGSQDARSCYTIMTGAPRHWSMWHQVSRNDMAGNPQNVARDLLASIRDGVIAVVENLVHTSLINTSDLALADTLHIQNQANSRKVDGKNMLGGNDLLGVARTIVDNSVGVEFPGGVFCVMTPRHAIQLLEGGDLRVDSMDVNGMDVVVSPAFWGGTDIGGGSALVAARDSVSVALSGLEVRMEQAEHVCRIGAQFSAGASIDPKRSARVIMER